MDPRFLAHNSHLEGTHLFEILDPQLRRLQTQPYRYTSELLGQLPRNIPGIYTLGGGRQVGKTTLLKQWMSKLLQNGIKPQCISFFSGELIDDHHALLHLLQQALDNSEPQAYYYLIIDEVTYIRDWDKTIKYLADIGIFDNVILILTGSDLIFIQEARMRFPGRQGRANIVNFHLYPLSFREVVTLKHGIIEKPESDLLFKEFKNYCIHGGYLTAINEFATQESISTATLRTYSDWIRGDMIKRGKQERYLKEVIHAIIKRANSQITWNALAKDLSIDHPKTIADYVTLLELMDAVFIQSALLEDKLVAAPKKAKKLFFTDPFIFHAMKSWLYPTPNPFEQMIEPELNNPISMAYLAELITVTQYRRLYPTYYIKAEGEVDIAYIDQQRPWPIEIKWTQQLREKDLKQILKYDNGLILTKNTSTTHIKHIPIEPLPYHLWSLNF